MEELLLSVLYVIGEILLEALLEIAGEAVFAQISRAIGNLFAPLFKCSQPLNAIGFAAAGMAAGLLSILVFPHRVLHPSRFHGISLLISPLITGLVMSQVGRAVRRRGQKPAMIESFGYG